MGILRHSLFLLVVCWFSFTLDAEAKTLYVCDDGRTVLLTDRAELGCPVYQPKGKLFIVPDGATWADVEWTVALRLAETKPPQSGASTAEGASQCQEWGDLNLRTDAGLDMETAENTRRWLALSRIVTTTNLCEEYLTKQVYPLF